MPKVVSIKETSPGVWRVSYDGHVLGDSRGYSKAQAWREATELVAKDQANAKQWEYDPLYVLGVQP